MNCSDCGRVANPAFGLTMSTPRCAECCRKVMAAAAQSHPELWQQPKVAAPTEETERVCSNDSRTLHRVRC